MQINSKVVEAWKREVLNLLSSEYTVERAEESGKEVSGLILTNTGLIYSRKSLPVRTLELKSTNQTKHLYLAIFMPKYSSWTAGVSRSIKTK